LHYVYDLWIQQWRKQKARGDVIIVRFADDSAPRTLMSLLTKDAA
jgi:hypothetical protein